MWKDNKQALTDFVTEDRFELNLYLSYLLDQISYDTSKQSLFFASLMKQLVNIEKAHKFVRFLM